MRRDVFQAIADPTRRQIINLIAHQTLTPNGVADSFDVSRQAISKHIKVLTQCGIVTIKQMGRERFCSIEAKKTGRSFGLAGKFPENMGTAL